jgi:hypothetical protein
MSGVFQNIDPPPPTARRRVCTPHLPLPSFGAGGGHTRWVERGMGGQYFGRRQTQLCTLHVVTVAVTDSIGISFKYPCHFPSPF